MGQLEIRDSLALRVNLALATVKAELQGDHSTSAPKGIEETVSKALALVGFRDGVWQLKIRCVHIRGDSHRLIQTVRAYEITPHKTIDLIVQPGDAASRRRCDLVVPHPYKLEDVLAKLAPKDVQCPSSMAEQLLSAGVKKIELAVKRNNVTDLNRMSLALNFWRKRGNCYRFMELIGPHIREERIEGEYVEPAIRKIYGTSCDEEMMDILITILVERPILVPLLLHKQQSVFTLSEYAFALLDDVKEAQEALKRQSDTQRLEELKRTLPKRRQQLSTLQQQVCLLSGQIEAEEAELEELGGLTG